MDTGGGSTRRGDAVDAWVGRQVALRRAALGLSQAALADRVGVSFQQLQKYENGSNRISASRLFRIASELATTPALFFPPGAAAAARGDRADTWMTGLVFLTATQEGRVVAEAFPRIADAAVRRSLARVVRALSTPG